MYPLGSCTMKYNPKINERVARLEGIAATHPLAPEPLVQGNLEILKTLGDLLAEVTGMDAVSLQPPAGASGELAGVMMIRACLTERGNPRQKVLIPDSAHGTNPASAVIAGYKVESLKSDAHGCVSLDALESAMNDEVAALMLTNPNTLGIFEKNILRIAEIVHHGMQFALSTPGNDHGYVAAGIQCEGVMTSYWLSAPDETAFSGAVAKTKGDDNDTCNALTNGQAAFGIYDLRERFGTDDFTEIRQWIQD